MHFVIGLLLFVAIMAITALLFAGWVVVSLGRGLWSLLFGGSQRRVTSPATLNSIICPRDRCRAPNLVGARFCRRCGFAMDPAVVQRRIAS